MKTLAETMTLEEAVNHLLRKCLNPPDASLVRAQYLPLLEVWQLGVTATAEAIVNKLNAWVKTIEGGRR